MGFIRLESSIIPSRRGFLFTLIALGSSLFSFKKEMNTSENSSSNYESLVKKLHPKAYVIVEVKIKDPQLEAKQDDIHRAQWGDFDHIDALNKRLLAQGELVDLKFGHRDDLAHWRYTFKNLQARETWSREISAKSSVSRTTTSFFSIRTDHHGKMYLHELSIG